MLNFDKAFFYLSNAITAVSSFPKLESFQYANIALDLLYQNLKWSGLLEPSKLSKHEEQMRACLKQTVNMTRKRLLPAQAAFLERVNPFVKCALEEIELRDVGEWNGAIQKAISSFCASEGEWHTPGEIKAVSEQFMQCFRHSVTDYYELSQTVLWGRIDSFQVRLEEIELRLEQLEKNTCRINSTLPHLLTNSPVQVDSACAAYWTQSIETVTRMLSSGNKKVMVNGLGGIGKTTLARIVYHNLKDCYQYAAWIDYVDSLEGSLYRQLIAYTEQRDYGERVQCIESFLTNNKDVLLVVDNVNKTIAEDLSLKFLDSLDSHILITSRQIEMGHFETYFLNPPDDDRCIDIFYYYYKMDRNRAQENIVKELVRMAKNHTLMIELLAKIAYTMGYNDLSVYLEDLQAKGIGSFSVKVMSEHTVFEDTLEAHLSKLFDISSVTVQQQRILAFFSLMPEVQVPFQVKDWMEYDINDLLKLCQLGWIQKSEGSYRMSDIVSRTVGLKKQMLSSEEIYQALGNTTYSCIMEEDPYPQLCVKLSISDACIRALEREDMLEGDGEEATLYLLSGLAHHQMCDYATALEHLKKAVGIAEKYWRHDELDMAHFYNSLAVTLGTVGEYDSALELFHKTVYIRRKRLGKYAPETAVVYNSLAEIYRIKGNYREAGKYDKQALAIRRKLFGEESEEMCRSYESLGSECVTYGNYKRALGFYQKVLSIREKQLGEGHFDTLQSYAKLIQVYLILEDQGKAVEYAEKAIGIMDKQHKLDHPGMLPLYDAIVEAYTKAGQNDKAALYCERIFSMQEESGNSQCLEQAVSYNNMGLLLLNNGNYREARDYFERAIDIVVRVPGAHGGIRANLFNNMGLAYYYLGDIEKALDHYKKAEGIFNDRIPYEYSILVKIWYNMSMAYQKIDNFKDAIVCYKKVGETIRKMDEKPHQIIASMCYNMADLCISSGEYAMALKCLKGAAMHNKDSKLSENIDKRIAMCEGRLSGRE